MTGNSDEARPGSAPGSRAFAGTMFAALYGELVPHPWLDPDTDRDAYWLFYHRSLAMGWLDEVGAAGLWGMNDADREHPLADAGASLVAWFQVGAEEVPAGRPLPVQPFLRCAGDAVARMGRLELTAVQVLLPVQGLDPSSRPAYGHMPSLQTAAWYGDGDPLSRTPVRVTLDSGTDPSIRSAAPGMREWMSQEQDTFVCESHSLSDPPPMAPPFDDWFWNGPPRHRVTFHGTLAEWSLDALGWLGGFLADLSARHGVSTPLLLTARRS
ncbi:hypothetical protein [Phytohabitans rumicis]|uniref:Uncharacterized protein n=1 Tax=Phytohabitans rumicis TaxID=1076125 RepID=A0A6V8LU94_9ACTN|nr:hypothetical protein [Phytohabitans rumicis]GFJ96335.1 hypothetical protein Prum_099770 [Phytohabitans rumicis]